MATELQQELNGWVVINENHPNNPKKKQIYTDTFSIYRKDSIRKFIAPSGYDWRYWQRKYNFKCVKAKMSISVTN